MIARRTGEGDGPPGRSPLAVPLPAAGPVGALRDLAGSRVLPAVVELPAEGTEGEGAGDGGALAALARELLPGVLLALRAQEDPTAAGGGGAWLPSTAALGAVDDVDATRGLGVALGGLLAALGGLERLGPVPHVAGGPDPHVGTAAAGRDADLVTRHGRALASGVRDAGVAVCGLSLPGLGALQHSGGPELELPRERWRERHLPPFAIAPWLDAVHVAAVAAPALGPGLASTGAWAGALLEETAHAAFHGLLVAAAADVAQVVPALRAGAHLVHLPRAADLPAAHAAIEEALRSGALAPELLAARTEATEERIRALRARRRWLPTPETAAARAVLAERAGALAERAVRLRRASLDLRPAAVVDLRDVPEHQHLRSLLAALRAAGIDAQEPRYPAETAEAPQLLALTGRGRADAAETAWLRELLARRPDAVVLHTGLPEHLPPAERTVVTLGAGPVPLRAAVRRLLAAGRG